MTKKQLQELRDNLSNMLFAAATCIRDDYELTIDAPEGIERGNKELYVDEARNIGYTISYNSKSRTVSIRGDLEYKDGSHQIIRSWSTYHFKLTIIVKEIMDFIIRKPESD